MAKNAKNKVKLNELNDIENMLVNAFRDYVVVRAELSKLDNNPAVKRREKLRREYSELRSSLMDILDDDGGYYGYEDEPDYF